MEYHLSCSAAVGAHTRNILVHVEILLECSFKGSKSFAVYLAKNEDRREAITRKLVSELGGLAADNLLKALKGGVAIRDGNVEGVVIPKPEPA
jgi:hypothetical protein